MILYAVVQFGGDSSRASPRTIARRRTLFAFLDDVHVLAKPERIG